MDTIGVRQLRQAASELLRRVAAGESIIVTDRGRPVARLVPIARSGGVADLIAADRVRMPRRRMRDAQAPITPPPGVSAAQALALARDAER